jgi:beta-glucosidase
VTTRRELVPLSTLAGVVVISAVAAASATPQNAATAQAVAYKNASLPVEARVADLLARMTPQEKVGQLLTVLGWEMYEKHGEQVAASSKLTQVLGDRLVGGLYGVLRADPWSKVTIATGLSPRQAAEAVNGLQRHALEKTRLGIPLLLAEECAHGHMAIGATVFPTGIGQASTFNPELIGRMAAAIAAETRASGGNVCYGPILDLARDPRWSRVEETYGEDPFLATQMGVAMVRSFQGAGLSRPDTVVATLKHFAAHGQSEGGHNGGPVSVGPRELYQTLLPPFKAAVGAGAGSVMTAYNEIDGIPCSANSLLLTEVLRTRWGFRGFVVSDLEAIPGLTSGHHVAADVTGAAAQALGAGVDSDLGGAAYGRLLAALEAGAISTELIDRAVRRVLKAKLELGLFDAPFCDPVRAERTVGASQHRELARHVARESLVLLKNEGNLLPLDSRLESIAVIGPNADSVYNQLGDYTSPQPAGKVITVLQGIRRRVLPATEVYFAKGCGVLDTSTAGFAEALDAARRSSAVVVVLGGSSARDFGTEFEVTGAARAALVADGRDMESGEGFDRATLDLPGVQLELLRQIVATGKPVALVLIKGRPLSLSWPVEHVPAILDAWYPGEEGGNAIADVLFGDYNPAGRLPISVPRSTGQLPVYYNGRSGMRRDYADSSAQPLLAFGHGLSYTRFAYSNLKILAEEKPQSVTVRVSVDVTNVGARAGDEVVQLYLRDLVASVTLPTQTLKAFQRIHLTAGATQTVVFKLGAVELALLNRDMRWVVEPGTFEVMLGASSTDIRLKGQLTLVEPLTLSG